MKKHLILQAQAALDHAKEVYEFCLSVKGTSQETRGFMQESFLPALEAYAEAKGYLMGLQAK